MKWQKRSRVPDVRPETLHVALSDAAAACDGQVMAVYVWNQDMEPAFPLAVLEYTVRGDTDPMHWHDHFEIALVEEGSGTFMFGRRSLAAEPGDVFFIDNSQPHVALADQGMPLRLLLVLFRPELLAGPAAGRWTLATSPRSASTRGRGRRGCEARRSSQPVWRPCCGTCSRSRSAASRPSVTSRMPPCAWPWPW